MRLLLVGAGHAHLHLLRHAVTLRDVGIDPVLLAPPTFHYSGTATAAAAGVLPAGHGRIDVGALATARDVPHVPGRAVGMDADARELHVDDGRTVEYDVLSLNVGSVPFEGPIEVGEDVLRVKPLDRLEALGRRLAELATRPGRVRVGVVGAGATGFEVAGHAAAALGERSEVVVFDRDPVPGAFLPAGARYAAMRVLVDRGVTFRVAERVTRVDANRVRTSSGGGVDVDLAVLATGLVANPVVADLGLGDDRGVPVRGTLQHVDDDHVLAAGDCARFLPRPLARIGVHGVRQGPVLLAGLRALATGGRPPSYVPPAASLQVVDLGGGRAVAVRGRWWWEGPGALRLKRAIDRRWLHGYQEIGRSA